MPGPLRGALATAGTDLAEKMDLRDRWTPPQRARDTADLRALTSLLSVPRAAMGRGRFRSSLLRASPAGAFAAWASQSIPSVREHRAMDVDVEPSTAPSVRDKRSGAESNAIPAAAVPSLLHCINKSVDEADEQR